MPTKVLFFYNVIYFLCLQHLQFCPYMIASLSQRKVNIIIFNLNVDPV